tara:strand:- start:316 stop:540 length:225 start_codon:yes stop_codon:yes gene_type:complete
VSKVLKDSKAIKVMLDLKVLKVSKVLSVIKVSKVLKVPHHQAQFRLVVLSYGLVHQMLFRQDLYCAMVIIALPI